MGVPSAPSTVPRTEAVVTPWAARGPAPNERRRMASFVGLSLGPQQRLERRVATERLEVDVGMQRVCEQQALGCYELSCRSLCRRFEQQRDGPVALAKVRGDGRAPVGRQTT